MYVCVLDQNGRTLMPTSRLKHVRELLSSGQAVRAKRNTSNKLGVFTIQLCYPHKGESQTVTAAFDPGRTNIGIAVVGNDGRCYYRADAVTNNKDIAKRMAKRAAQRRQHRALRRQRRRRRARKAGTIKAAGFERLLPGYETPITCHDIRNKKARFNNRKRSKGRLTPSANQLLQMHIGLYKLLKQVFPITQAAIEVNRFAFAQMDNPTVAGLDFQNGPLKGYDNKEAAVYDKQRGCCLLCGKHQIDHYHHIVPRHLNGSDTADNIVGLCNACHDSVHKSEKLAKQLAKLKAGKRKKYAGISVLNQVLPFICAELTELDPLFVTTGRETFAMRELLSLLKDHAVDAYIIGCNALEVEPQMEVPALHLLRHFRRHERNAVHQEFFDRKYYLDGTLVCTNRRKATEQKKDSLAEFRMQHSVQEISRLSVKEHDPAYSLSKEYMPGSTYLANGRQHLLNNYSGTATNKAGRRPSQCIDSQNNTLSYLQCKFVMHNSGWSNIGMNTRIS